MRRSHSRNTKRSFSSLVRDPVVFESANVMLLMRARDLGSIKLFSTKRMANGVLSSHGNNTSNSVDLSGAVPFVVHPRHFNSQLQICCRVNRLAGMIPEYLKWGK